MPSNASEKFKIVLLSSGLGYVSRGIEIWMMELAPLLANKFDVQLWSGGPAPKISGCATRALRGVSRDAKTIERWSWHRRYQMEQLSILAQTVLHLRRQHVDLVYCGDPVLSWHLKRFRHIHGAKVVFMNGMRLSGNWAQDFDGVHLLAPPYLDAIRNELPGRDISNFFAVPHFVDLTRFFPTSTAERDEVRRQWGLPQGKFIILTVGPVGNVSNKRLEWLAAEIASLDANFHLVSAGVDEDGAEAVRDQTSALLRERVTFLGRVDRAKIPQLYHAADAYSLGSLAEPFSIAILEALASGLPVVHHCDSVMVWQTGGGGVSVDMTVKGKAARAFQKLQSRRQQYEETARAARKLAEERYAPESVSREISLALTKICERKKAS